MKLPILALALIGVARVCAATNLDVAAIDAAIRTGALGSEVAERARGVEDLRIREITGEKIPFQLFSFSDYRGGYTLLVEDEKTFVLLCSAFGGGDARQFTIEEHDGRTVLCFLYYSGSGRTFEHRAKYVIGSGKSEEIGSPRDVTNER
jgi:hypothetical protein